MSITKRREPEEKERMKRGGNAESKNERELGPQLFYDKNGLV
jgi:hypothetical protein